MTILNWPTLERPREKLLHQSESALSDAELIAIFLRTGSHGKTALDLARELLQEFGSLKRLREAPLSAFMTKKGLGAAKYAALKAAFELGRRSAQERLQIGQTLNNSDITRQFIQNELDALPIEVFACVFMDSHFRFLAFEKLSVGTINQASVYPREIVKRALHLNAVRVILAHNHPSGLAKPSTADRAVTQLIIKALRLIEVEVVDHFIIGHPETYSFAENGLL